MIIDGASLSGTTVNCDICIVGTGAAGFALARQIQSCKSGVNVVVLESGIKNEKAARGHSDRRWWDPLVAQLDRGKTNTF